MRESHPRPRGRTSRWLTAGLCAAVAATLVGGPSASASRGIGPDVAAARAVWLAAVADRHEAAGHVSAVEEELVAAEAALAEAQAAHEAAAAELTARVAVTAAARAHHAAAVAARIAAGHDVTAAARVHDRLAEQLADRRARLADAAATAYVHGDPTLRMLVSTVRALNTAESAGAYMAAVEHLRWVTIDSRGRHDAARAQTDNALAIIEERLDRLAARVVAEARAAEDLAAAEDAEDEQRVVVEDLETLVADRSAIVEAQLAAVDAARARLAARERVLGRALTAVQSFGWRAGVPGPGGLTWPVDGPPGSGFGPRFHPLLEEVRSHNGVDVSAPTGTPVVAAAAGRVAHAGPRGGYGNAVIIAHPGGRHTLYAHLHTVETRAGRNVAEAEMIGTVGSTGLSTGPHLHFEVHDRGRPRDPMQYFRGR